MELVMLLIPVVLTGMILAALPHFYRPTQVFGNTVPVSFRDSEEARSMRRAYQRDVLLWSTLAVLLLVAFPQHPAVRAAATPVVQVGGALMSWLRQRRHLRAAVLDRPLASAGELPERRGGMYGGWLLWILPFGLLALAAAYIYQNAHVVPERIPTHYGFNGPDRWGPRNWRTLYGPLLIGALVLSTVFTIGMALVYGSRRGQTQAQDEFRVANLRLMLGMMYSVAFLLAVLGTAPVRAVLGPAIPWWIPLAALHVVLIVFGWQVFKANRDSEGPDATPDDCWHFGDFYYNRADPAFVVEKRFGVGYTVNFAHKAAWLLVGQVLLLLVATIWIVRG